MNNPPSCEQTCTQSCATPCTSREQPERVSLAAARERFDREAVRGVCDTGRYRCRYVIRGEGPPLLLLHGLADNREAFLLLGAALARSFRCIAYDLPAGGADGADLRHYAHADLVNDVGSLLDHLGIARSYVFASSFGTSIALAALRKQPDRLPRAVLQAPVVCKPLTRTERGFAWMMSHWPGSMAALPFRQRFLRRLHQVAFAGQAPEVWDHFLTCTGTIPVRAVGHRARLLHRLDLRPLLGEVRQPVMLVCGDEDPLVRREALEEVLRGLPGAGLFLLEGSGHFPALTHPEMLAEVIRFFLTPPTAADGKIHIADCRVI